MEETDELRTKPKIPSNDWHSWMDAVLHIMLQKYYPEEEEP